MNKLRVDKDKNITIENKNIDIEILVDELTLNVKGNVVINDITKKDNEKLKLTINILENSKITYNKFIILNKMDNHITLNLKENSSIIFNESILTYENSSLVFDSNIYGNDNKCIVNIKAVTEDKGSICVKAECSVKEKIINNDFLENIRILALNDEENIIIPNLLVSSNEVAVNHNATISNIDSDYLFYLNSKGLSNEKSFFLIKKGYLINNLDINEQDKNKIEDLIKK